MMKHCLLAMVFLAWLGVSSAWGVQASPFPIETSQPDGTKIEFFRKGDEKCNWVETPDGYTLIKNEKTGYWEYAEEKTDLPGLFPMGITVKAGEEPPVQILEKENFLKTPSFEVAPEIAEQPDGTKIILLWQEKNGLRWRTTRKGFPVVQNHQTGYWEYATWKPVIALIPSGIIYNPQTTPPESWAKHKKPSNCH